ncbi:hypothetical protein [Algoriphagus persicinus]|uniref:hypothetical protein n=1 Tax=Algoriphagus persicinus TaxID=3108754 RepID=UPI002B390751|nr:hypothetical protein [Algoriphagus sp. E1-3-M2]MEB2785280.1 hypothetical protein [Algoriphagus sp. E1-3-M2]
MNTHDPVPTGTHRGMIISQHPPHQQICLWLGRAWVTQQRARRLACGVKLCWRLDFLVLLRQGKRTKKSSITQASHTGMIIMHARFSRSAAADGTGYMAFKKQI